jgi:hypothetical protein
VNGFSAEQVDIRQRISIVEPVGHSLKNTFRRYGLQLNMCQEKEMLLLQCAVVMQQ